MGLQKRKFFLKDILPFLGTGMLLFSLLYTRLEIPLAIKKKRKEKIGTEVHLP
jgi:hypothetical protein